MREYIFSFGRMYFVLIVSLRQNYSNQKTLKSVQSVGELDKLFDFHRYKKFTLRTENVLD